MYSNCSRRFIVPLLCAFAVVLGGAIAIPDAAAASKSLCAGKGGYTEDLGAEACTFVNTGRNRFWVLDPGFVLHLQGSEGKDEIDLMVTALPDTELVDGVLTRVIEEREKENGELVEVSRNFFAMCLETSDIFYFGEEVDLYEGGVIVGHEGEWRAGENGAKPGIIMPGTFLLGSRYFQEIAPDVAMDRGCNLAMGLTVETPAGTFNNCVEVRETSPIEPGAKSRKLYCPGIGLVFDDGAELVDWSEGP